MLSVRTSLMDLTEVVLGGRGDARVRGHHRAGGDEPEVVVELDGSGCDCDGRSPALQQTKKSRPNDHHGAHNPKNQHECSRVFDYEPSGLHASTPVSSLISTRTATFTLSTACSAARSSSTSVTSLSARYWMAPALKRAYPLPASCCQEQVERLCDNGKLYQTRE